MFYMPVITLDKKMDSYSEVYCSVGLLIQCMHFWK